MPKIPDCDRCILYARNPYVICTVHPSGVETNSCIDFRLNANSKIEEQWSPEGYSWYGDELITNRPSRYSQSEQLEILNTHPFFTSVCPQQLDWARSGNPTAPLVQCRHEFNRNERIIHFDCPNCDFVDDSV